MLIATFYRFLYPLALLLARFFSLFNSKLRQGFRLRKKINGHKPWLIGPKNSQPLWFHCASGEFEYAKPVIRLIQNQYPKQAIIVTFFSPSVLSSLKSFPGLENRFFPTPWDKEKEWQEFIDYHQPKALLIARTDLWPMMLSTAKKNKIPSLLFSKTYNASKSSRQKQYNNWLLGKLDTIFCVSDEDALATKKELGPQTDIREMGDTRYDQCLYRISQNKPIKALNNFHRPLFVAGSTWEADEKVLLPFIKKNIQKTSFVIAPHEPTPQHIQNLQQQLREHKLESQLYSQTSNWNPQALLIIDGVGILADLYKWAQYAWVGGAMEKSVHSVMEPLALGLFTFVGPHHQNNREALQFKEMSFDSIPGVQEIHNSKELIEKFNQLQTQWNPQMQNDLRLRVSQKAGASKNVLRWVKTQTNIQDN